jgi:hypothetical protein
MRRRQLIGRWTRRTFLYNLAMRWLDWIEQRERNEVDALDTGNHE